MAEQPPLKLEAHQNKQRTHLLGQLEHWRSQKNFEVLKNELGHIIVLILWGEGGADLATSEVKRRQESRGYGGDPVNLICVMVRGRLFA